MYIYNKSSLTTTKQLMSSTIPFLDYACKERMNFTDYLIYAKSQLDKLDQYRVIRIVLGNESSDLDSTVSACVYAYFLYLTCLNKDEILHLPIINTNLSTYRLRNEIRWLLKENFLNVIFIDEINLNELHHRKKLEIILVDHHHLRSKLNEAVVEIIDHHQIKQDSIVLENSSPIKIEPVGSCCTLIAEKLISAKFPMTEDVAYLLIGTIVFDTVDFSAAAGKTTNKDREIYAQLQTYLQSPIDHSKLFSDLRESASDATGYSIQDLLQKDVKQTVGPNLRLIMSSLPVNFTVEKLITKIKTTDDFNEFLSKNEDADGLIMISIENHDDKIQRQLGIYVKNIAHLQSLTTYLQSPELNLDLHERCLPINHAQLKFFDQNNVRSSRKQILPFVEKFVLKFEK